MCANYCAVNVSRKRNQQPSCVRNKPHSSSFVSAGTMVSPSQLIIISIKDFRMVNALLRAGLLWPPPQQQAHALNDFTPLPHETRAKHPRLKLSLSDGVQACLMHSFGTWAPGSKAVLHLPLFPGPATTTKLTVILSFFERKIRMALAVHAMTCTHILCSAHTRACQIPSRFKTQRFRCCVRPHNLRVSQSG